MTGLKRHLCEKYLTQIKITKSFINSKVTEFGVFTQLQDRRSYRFLILECQICDAFGSFQAWKYLIFIPSTNTWIHFLILKEHALKNL